MTDTIRAAHLRTSAAEYAARFIGTPYLWGGDSPMEGFDCSGLLVEVLQAHGVIERGRDYTAHGLRELFIGRDCPEITGLGYAGCLVFWPGRNNRIGQFDRCAIEHHDIGAVSVQRDRHLVRHPSSQSLVVSGRIQEHADVVVAHRTGVSLHLRTE